MIGCTANFQNPAFLASDILSLGGKLRMFGEPFAGRRPSGDESVFDFAARRIGPEAAAVLVDDSSPLAVSPRTGSRRTRASS